MSLRLTLLSTTLHDLPPAALRGDYPPSWTYAGGFTGLRNFYHPETGKLLYQQWTYTSGPDRPLPQKGLQPTTETLRDIAMQAARTCWERQR